MRYCLCVGCNAVVLFGCQVDVFALQAVEDCLDFCDRGIRGAVLDDDLRRVSVVENGGQEDGRCSPVADLWDQLLDRGASGTTQCPRRQVGVARRP